VAAEQAAPAPCARREAEHLALGAAEHQEREGLLLSAGGWVGKKELTPSERCTTAPIAWMPAGAVMPENE
jgi:hypothetical protein